jgi:hypothetical protein
MLILSSNSILTGFSSYTNAHGTHKQLVKAVEEGIAFAWHGGDISYADDWYV